MTNRMCVECGKVAWAADSFCSRCGKRLFDPQVSADYEVALGGSSPRSEQEPSSTAAGSGAGQTLRVLLGIVCVVGVGLAALNVIGTFASDAPVGGDLADSEPVNDITPATSETPTAEPLPTRKEPAGDDQLGTGDATVDDGASVTGIADWSQLTDVYTGEECSRSR